MLQDQKQLYVTPCIDYEIHLSVYLKVSTLINALKNLNQSFRTKIWSINQRFRTKFISFLHQNDDSFSSRINLLFIVKKKKKEKMGRLQFQDLHHFDRGKIMFLTFYNDFAPKFCQ